MPALPHARVAAAIETVQASKATRMVKLAFEFLVLTAARSGEVRLATRDEIDTAGALWTISGDAYEGQTRAPALCTASRTASCSLTRCDLLRRGNGQ